MCFTSTLGYGIIVQAPLFNLYWNPPCMMLIWDCAIICFCLLILPALLFHSVLSLSFEFKRNTIRILCWQATLKTFDLWKIFVCLDVLKLLLNLQENLCTSANLRHFTKISTQALLIYPQLNYWKSYIKHMKKLYLPSIINI